VPKLREDVGRYSALVPQMALQSSNAVFKDAQKYADDSWKRVKHETGRSSAALARLVRTTAVSVGSTGSSAASSAASGTRDLVHKRVVPVARATLDATTHAVAEAAPYIQSARNAGLGFVSAVPGVTSDLVWNRVVPIARTAWDATTDAATGAAPYIQRAGNTGHSFVSAVPGVVRNRVVPAVRATWSKWDLAPDMRRLVELAKHADGDRLPTLVEHAQQLLDDYPQGRLVQEWLAERHRLATPSQGTKTCASDRDCTGMLRRRRTCYRTLGVCTTADTEKHLHDLEDVKTTDTFDALRDLVDKSSNFEQHKGALVEEARRMAASDDGKAKKERAQKRGEAQWQGTSTGSRNALSRQIANRTQGDECSGLLEGQCETKHDKCSYDLNAEGPRNRRTGRKAKGACLPLPR
jgi:hypothetical protein